MSNDPQPPQPYAGEPAASQPPYQQPVQQPQYPAPGNYPGGASYAPVKPGPQGLSLGSMIIGLSSLVLVGGFIVPQIVGIVLGHLGLKGESPQGRAFAITGLITNYLALLIYAGIWIFFILFFVVLAGTSGYEYSM